MLAVIQHFTTVLGTFSTGTLAASIGVVAEVILRLIPSTKPMSVLLALEGILTGAAQLLNAASTALNSVVPQNTTSTSTVASVATDVAAVAAVAAKL